MEAVLRPAADPGPLAEGVVRGTQGAYKSKEIVMMAATQTAKSVSDAAPGKAKRRAILGKKLGMTQLFLESGERVPVTVLQAGPCSVLQVKTPARDGYSAVQVGFDETHKPRKRPQQAVLDRLGLKPMRFVHEVPVVDPADFVGPGSSGTGDGSSQGVPPQGAPPQGAAEDAPSAEGEAAEPPAAGGAEGVEEGEGSGPAPGSLLSVGIFKDTPRVDVRGVTKGRGFAGTIRRFGFNAGPKSHGSKNIREPGGTGMHTDPGRVLPGRKMPGHLGAVQRKARNLSVVKVDEEQNLLIVKGSVPGPRGGYLYIEESLSGR